MDPEPLEGITDAIQAADKFLAYARAHRDWPDKDAYRQAALGDAADLIAKLQALGRATGEDVPQLGGFVEKLEGGVSHDRQV